MYIKIYFSDKPLFLCDAIDATIQPFVHHDDAVFIDELNSHTVRTMIHEMSLDKVHAGVFYHKDLEALKKAFFRKFTGIIAAGGLIRNEKDQLLMIFRRGKWDLPKGKLDKGETTEECAIREVMEETGLREVKLGKPLQTTYHTYHEGARFFLKESRWYRMEASTQQPLVPQEAEQIQEVRWMPLPEIEKLFHNTFPSVIDVITEYKKDH